MNLEKKKICDCKYTIITAIKSTFFRAGLSALFFYNVSFSGDTT